MQRQRPPELEELTRLLAYPREALVGLKRQQAAVQAALWEMEQSLTRYQSALSSCSLSWPGYEPAVAKEEEPASVEGHNPMVHVNVDQVMDPEQGHQQEEADEDTPPSCKTHLEDLDASISPHTRRLLKKVREQTTLQKQKSLEIHPSEGLWKRTRLVCTKLIKKDWFECLISFVIVANSAIIGVDSHMSLPIPGETVKGSGLAWASEAEIFFLVFYSVELAIRAIALQSKCFRDGWFIFDAILVTSAYIEQLLSLINVQSEQQIMILRLLRLIRLVRTFRMIRQIKSIWRLLYGLLTCGELLISTLALLGMVIYVFAVLGLETIASNQEMREDDNIQRLLDERFSSLGVTMMTLTQFVTLDSLSSLYLPLIKKNAWLMFYFLGLIIIVSIALMNLVTAVLVEGALEHARQDIFGSSCWGAT
ncbi:Scn11a [Symbiodinium microadriaticum]|nr:Scn11a [Symbiodinium microadriaticum]